MLSVHLTPRKHSCFVAILDLVIKASRSVDLGIQIMLSGHLTPRKHSCFVAILDLVIKASRSVDLGIQIILSRHPDYVTWASHSKETSLFCGNIGSGDQGIPDLLIEASRLYYL